MEQQKPVFFYFKLFTFFLLVLSLASCQTQKTKLEPEPEPVFPVASYVLNVKGIVFKMDLPLTPGQNIQQQQDNVFSSLKDSEGKDTSRYLYTSKMPDDDSSYLLRSGIQVHSPDHTYDTFLEYKFIGKCENKNDYLHCEYHATEGRYEIDMPSIKTFNQQQTETQMQENEILIMSKLNSHSRSFKEVMETSYSLSQLNKKAKALKINAAIKGSKLIFSRPSYKYSVELTQEKVKKTYVSTLAYEVFAQKNGLNSTDFVEGYKEAKKDAAKLMGKN